MYHEQYVKNVRTKYQLRYLAVAERLCSDEFGAYDTYGLCAEVKIHGEWEPAGTLHDVAPGHSTAYKMAEMFTSGQLSLLHLRDVVEDML